MTTLLSKCVLLSRGTSTRRCFVPQPSATSDRLHKVNEKSCNVAGFRLQGRKGLSCVAESTECGDAVNEETRDGVLQSRRVALCLLGALSLSVGRCDAAYATFSPGFSGLKDWLRGQKQKTAGFLLAPINASRDRLSSALQIISADFISTNSFEEAGNLVKVAARDCMPLEAGSILDFQRRAGVEVCTFKLVLKNAASLLDDADPRLLRAEESLSTLIRSFVTLDQILASGASGESPNRSAMQGALEDTSVALDRFEGGVRACLGIA